MDDDTAGFLGMLAAVGLTPVTLIVNTNGYLMLAGCLACVQLGGLIVQFIAVWRQHREMQEMIRRIGGERV